MSREAGRGRTGMVATYAVWRLPQLQSRAEAVFSQEEAPLSSPLPITADPGRGAGKS